MPARLAGLGDDCVHAEPLELDGLGDGRRRAEDDAAHLPDLLEGQDAEREAEHRHALLGDHRELRLDQSWWWSRQSVLRLGEAKLGAEWREDRLHRRDPLDVGLGRRQRCEEVDAERTVCQTADRDDRVPQLIRPERRAPERAESTRVGDGCHELGRREAPGHGSLDDRIARPEKLRGPGVEAAHRSAGGAERSRHDDVRVETAVRRRLVLVEAGVLPAR